MSGGEQHGMFENLDHDKIVAHLGDTETEVKDKWPALIVEIIDLLKTARVSQGATEDQAKSEALDLTELLCKTFGGMQVYLPKGRQLEVAVRNKKIWNDFTGDNVPNLTIKYDLTQVRIYEILKEQRQLHIKSKQDDMFS